MTNDGQNNTESQNAPVTAAMWREGARLRTLPAAAAPVAVGIGAAIQLGGFSWVRSLLALVVALALQVGVNFANDYSDGVRGTDANRVGPTRLTASGAVSPRRVLALALVFFAIAAVAGLVLVILSAQWWLLAVGALAILAAWFYTGGKRPYGYSGYGQSELMVFVFFGLVATLGTTWVQVQSAPAWLWAGAAGAGFMSVALLLVNNIRDIPTDREVGKTTLAVRLGDWPSRVCYQAVTMSAAVCGGLAAGGAQLYLTGGALVMLILGVCAIVIAQPLLRGATGTQLLPVLRWTGLLTLLYGILVGVAVALPLR